MSNPYITDLIVRLTCGLPIHTNDVDVDWLISTLEVLDKHGGLEAALEVAEQEGYERGYEDAKETAEAQIEVLCQDHDDWPENVISELEGWTVDES